jgi:DNA-binding CsgD family transcriptional regulator
MSADPSNTIAAPSAGQDPATQDTADQDHISFDTTLRAGEEAPGASTTLAEQLRIAELLERMGQQIDPLARLSKRERMIAKRFAEGLTYREIGDRLHIAPSTVRTHLATIYRKLEIRKKSTLVSLVVGSSNTAALSLLAVWIEAAVRGTAPKPRGIDFPRAPSHSFLQSGAIDVRRR